jgi:hypothetical protein
MLTILATSYADYGRTAKMQATKIIVIHITPNLNSLAKSKGRYKNIKRARDYFYFP